MDDGCILYGVYHRRSVRVLHGARKYLETL